MKHLVLLLSCVWFTGCDGCSSNSNPPGTDTLGTYALHADGASKMCSLPDIAPTLDFPVTAFRRTDAGQLFFNYVGTTWDAGFDGQVLTAVSSGPQDVSWDGGSCSPCTETQTMAFTFAILSKSQSKAVGDMCPANPLDGGVPGEDPDAGIFRPSFTDAGFDGVRICGELRVTIDGTGTGFCDSACNGCVLNYRVSGQRQ